MFNLFLVCFRLCLRRLWRAKAENNFLCLYLFVRAHHIFLFRFFNINKWQQKVNNLTILLPSMVCLFTFSPILHPNTIVALWMTTNCVCRWERAYYTRQWFSKRTQCRSSAEKSNVSAENNSIDFNGCSSSCVCTRRKINFVHLLSGRYSPKIADQIK